MFINSPHCRLGYDSPGHSLNNVDPNLVQLQFSRVNFPVAPNDNNGSESGSVSTVGLSMPLFSSTPRSPDKLFISPDCENVGRVDEVIEFLSFLK